MNKRIILFSLIICSYFGFSQTKIEKEAIKYLRLIEEGKHNLALEYIYPKFYEIENKADLLESMNMQYKNPNIELRFSTSKIVKINKESKIDSLRFCKIFYTVLNSFNAKMNYLSPEISKSALNESHKLMNELFGKENVKFDSVKERFTIKMTKVLLAIRNENSENWKFVEFDEYLKPKLLKILPEEILK